MMPHSPGPTHGCGCAPHHYAPPVRHCRQEPKELLVQGDKANAAGGEQANNPATGVLVNAPAAASTGQAIIGGGCCVQLSVEYMPATISLQDQACNVIIEVQDSEGTLLAWSKQFKEGYHVKECVITTYPGAKLIVLVKNAIARVRWCEIFSC
jgi:hypothetical protein